MLKFYSTKIVKQGPSWETFLTDAKSQLTETEERAVKLRESIRFFERKIKSGEPVPEGLEGTLHENR